MNNAYIDKARQAYAEIPANKIDDRVRCLYRLSDAWKNTSTPPRQIPFDMREQLKKRQATDDTRPSGRTCRCIFVDIALPLPAKRNARLRNAKSNWEHKTLSPNVPKVQE